MLTLSYFLPLFPFLLGFLPLSLPPILPISPLPLSSSPCSHHKIVIIIFLFSQIYFTQLYMSYYVMCIQYKPW